METNKKKRAGFTLVELLIVVAIVGVLVAISIPIFSSRLHKAQEATDMANLRSYFAELQEDYMTTGKYDPNIGTNIWDLKDTITYPNGKQVKLKTGVFSVVQPTDPKKVTYGYQIYYYCKKNDGCFLALGATG